jgi:hypothetical protein
MNALHPDVVTARINLRVAELKVLAAKTAIAAAEITDLIHEGLQLRQKEFRGHREP